MLAAFSTLPPELFFLIASFIPLRSAPQTLCSLALGNRRFHDIVRPILYSRIILKSEEDASTVIQRILDESQLGLAVTELYILPGLTTETENGKNVVVGLYTLITKHLIPRIIALGVYVLGEWDYDDDFKPILYGRVLADLWSNICDACPRLRTLILRHVGYSFTHPWIFGPMIDEISSLLGLSVLRLEWNGNALEEEDDLKIWNNLPQLALSLHTLSLRSDLLEATTILSLNFPNLTYLRLHGFVSNNETAQVLNFFTRHPHLENVSLIGCRDTWFAEQVPDGFLPNLKHLKARFDDIRKLTSVLPQLTSLSFAESYNAQVPYLLRAVMPSGLPNLKSLEIEQEILGWASRRLEGILWYETACGQFHLQENREKIPRNFTDGYMHSIVRGAPNLEELGLQSMTLTTAHLHALAPDLSQLTNMKRFYYEGFSPNPKYDDLPPPSTHAALHAEFLASAEMLARACPRLEQVTSISGTDLPYVSAKIVRDRDGDVEEVRRSEGVGMLISADEDDPFPFNV